MRTGTGNRNGYRGHLGDRAVDLIVACRYKAFPGYFWVYVPPILFGLLVNQGMQHKRLESQTISGSRLIISRFLLYHQDECYPSLELGCCCSRFFIPQRQSVNRNSFLKNRGQHNAKQVLVISAFPGTREVILHSNARIERSNLTFM